MEVAAAVDVEADDHTEVADSGHVRACGAGRILHRGEPPVYLNEPVKLGAGVYPFPDDDPGVVDRRGERAERRRDRIADRAERAGRPGKGDGVAVVSV